MPLVTGKVWSSLAHHWWFRVNSRSFTHLKSGRRTLLFAAIHHEIHSYLAEFPKKATWIPLFARHMCLLMSNHRHQLRKTNWKPSATARLQCYPQALELLIVFLLSWGHAPCHQMSISGGGISAKPTCQLNEIYHWQSGKHLPENWHCHV